MTQEPTTPTTNATSEPSSEDTVVEIEAKPTDPNDEKQLIKPLIDSTALQAGDKWFLIAGKWFKAWKEYVGYASLYYRTPLNPGPIDNSSLVARGCDPNQPKIVDDLLCDFDYVLVPRSVWLRLHSWYDTYIE
jgi:hypothetical protein